jgi:hypothetical protein
MAGPGRILLDSQDKNKVTAVLYNFDIAKHELKPEHADWLRRNVVPLLRAGGSMVILGLASPSGPEGFNEPLSQRRIDAVVAFLRKESPNNFKIAFDLAAGEKWARALGVRDGTEDEKWRSVVLSAWNRPTPPPPPPPKPPTVAGCAVIHIPSLALPPWFLLLLDQLSVQLPTQARCLDQAEVNEAWKVYGDSLAYDDIHVSDAVGAKGRPVTTAIPVGGNRWIVALNMGPSAFRVPNFAPITLIHELAHAWQSQHYPDKPYQYMVNCLNSQTWAETESFRNKPVVSGLLGHWQPALRGNGLGDADAYSYVPGKPFGDYGGEQTAQQVEDFFNQNSPAPITARSKIAIIAKHMKEARRGAADRENIRSLSSIKVDYKDRPNVVWHG